MQKDRYIVRQEEAKVVFHKEKRIAHLILFNDMLVRPNSVSCECADKNVQVITKQTIREKEKPSYNVHHTFMLKHLSWSANAVDTTEKPHHKSQTDSEQEDQLQEKEKPQEPTGKLDKERCKFRLTETGADPKDFYEFTMKDSLSCAHWIAELDRLREELNERAEKEKPMFINGVLSPEPGRRVPRASSANEASILGTRPVT